MTLTLDRKLLVGVSAALVAMTLFGGFVGRTATVEGTYDYLRVFNEALYLAVNNYVEPVALDALMKGAYRGLLESLDPANEYLTPEQFQKAGLVATVQGKPRPDMASICMVGPIVEVLKIEEGAK